MQKGCGLAGHLSGKGKTKDNEDYVRLETVQYEKKLRKPYYIKNSIKKEKFGKIIKAVFKYLKGGGRKD